MLLRKEQADKLKAKLHPTNLPKGQKIPNTKKQPKERYSKLPVSILRPLNLEPSKPKLTRDPRFDNMSGNLNEGLFRESYSFVKDLRNERINTLKEYIGQGKDKKGDDYKQKVHKLREMLGEERDAMNKAAQKSRDKAILKEAKLENR